MMKIHMRQLLMIRDWPFIVFFDLIIMDSLSTRTMNEYNIDKIVC